MEIGRNYGWPNVEGFCDPGGEQTFCTSNNVKEPILVWTPTIAPSDMIYYNNSLFPEFDGRVLMSVLKDKRIIAMKLSADGLNVINEDHYLINQFGRLRDICVGPNKEIYLATNGSSWSNTNPNTHTIIVLKPLENVGVSTAFMEDFKIYPNPIDGDFTVEMSINEIGALMEMKDMSGRVLYQSVVAESTELIDTSMLSKGVYSLTFTKGNESITKMIVK